MVMVRARVKVKVGLGQAPVWALLLTLAAPRPPFATATPNDHTSQLPWRAMLKGSG